MNTLAIMGMMSSLSMGMGSSTESSKTNDDAFNSLLNSLTQVNNQTPPSVEEETTNSLAYVILSMLYPLLSEKVYDSNNLSDLSEDKKQQLLSLVDTLQNRLTANQNGTVEAILNDVLHTSNNNDIVQKSFSGINGNPNVHAVLNDKEMWIDALSQIKKMIANKNLPLLMTEASISMENPLPRQLITEGRIPSVFVTKQGLMIHDVSVEEETLMLQTETIGKISDTMLMNSTSTDIGNKQNDASKNLFVVPIGTEEANVQVQPFSLASSIEGDTVSPTEVKSTIWNSNNIKEELESFIQRHIQLNKMNNQGISEARITLFPEHLGQVDVKVTSNQGVVSAQLITETGFGRELLESQINQLRQTLGSQGINIDKIVVSQGSSLSHFHQDGRQHQSQSQTPYRGKPSDNSRSDESERIDFFEANRFNYDQSNGGYDHSSYYKSSSVDYSV